MEPTCVIFSGEQITSYLPVMLHNNQRRETSPQRKSVSLKYLKISTLQQKISGKSTASLLMHQTVFLRWRGTAYCPEEGFVFATINLSSASLDDLTHNTLLFTLLYLCLIWATGS